MTKSPQYHNRDQQFQFIRFQNEWRLSKMRFLHSQFLEFGLIRKLVSYQIRKIAFLLSGKRLLILCRLIGRKYLTSDWLMIQMKTFYSFNDREVILKHQYKFTSNVKALHPLKGNGGQLKNPDISGAIFTLSSSIRILNSQCVEGARDVRVL